MLIQNKMREIIALAAHRNGIELSVPPGNDIEDA